MSQISNGIFGALAIGLTLGAVQLASGHDLTGRQQLASGSQETVINRATKADRGAVRIAPGKEETIVLRPDGVSDTSVLVRIPVAKDETRNRPVAPTKPAKAKTAVACEPPVSVLTEVAKLLQPGRCVT